MLRDPGRPCGGAYAGRDRSAGSGLLRGRMTAPLTDSAARGACSSSRTTRTKTSPRTTSRRCDPPRGSGVPASTEITMNVRRPAQDRQDRVVWRSVHMGFNASGIERTLPLAARGLAPPRESPATVPGLKRAQGALPAQTSAVGSDFRHRMTQLGPTAREQWRSCVSGRHASVGGRPRARSRRPPPPRAACRRGPTGRSHPR